MNDFDKEAEETKRGAKSLGFYAVLAFSMLAVGAAAWSATVGIDGLRDITADKDDTASTQSVEQAEIKVESIPAPPITSEVPPRVARPVIEPAEEIPDTVAHFFIMPVSGMVTKKFSNKELFFSETFGDLRLHNGIDIAAEIGAQVKSAGNGTVEKIYKDGTLGNVVVIDHGNGVQGFYCGLNNTPSVEEGQSVLSGTLLGSLTTVPYECADAPHLHFEMRKDGELVSPLGLMNLEAE